MYGMWTSGHAFQKAGRKKYQRFTKKGLKNGNPYGKIENRDILLSLFPAHQGTKRPKGGTTSMNKYELALVVNAKIDDEARAAVVEKAKNYIARYNGTVTEVEEWGKKRLAYEIQKMREGYYYFIQFESDAACPAEVEGRIRIMDNVLRYLVVKKEA
jgi:small subunit ribosomal protein S6